MQSNWNSVIAQYSSQGKMGKADGKNDCNWEYKLRWIRRETDWYNEDFNRK